MIIPSRNLKLLFFEKSEDPHEHLDNSQLHVQFHVHN